MWLPSRLWPSDGGFTVYDQAGNVLRDCLLDGSSVRVRPPRELRAPWWTAPLPPAAAAAIQDAVGADVAAGRLRIGDVSAGGDGTWCIAFNEAAERRGPTVLLGSGGRIEARFCLDAAVLAYVSGLAHHEGQLVMADYTTRSVVSVDTCGHLRWRYRPEAEDRYSPSACALVNGEFLIACRMSSRVTRLGPDGEVRSDEDTTGPESVASLAAVARDTAVGADSASGRLYSYTLTPDRVVPAELWHSLPCPPTGSLSFPRAVVPTGDGVLIADTNHGRVIRAGLPDESSPDGRAEVETVFRGGGWPRSVVRRGPCLLIADGLESRLRTVDTAAPGRPVSDLPVHDDAGPVRLGDPHHLALGRSHYWITDSELNDVLCIGLDGRLQWRWTTGALAGDALNNPHQALPCADGSLIVVDSLNHRVIRAAPGLRKTETLIGPGDVYYPRFVVPTADGWLVTEHTATIAAFDRRWRRVGSLTLLPAGGTRTVHLIEPPRAAGTGGGKLYISDYARGIVYVADV
ncbi:hypothetical protein [Nonomuraea helvata]|uniref:Uncharacterized protein n=1 Tax=Nonomuraea helvata TaxID=37484 RepID=A0ABV5SAC9_9ACTN